MGAVCHVRHLHHTLLWPRGPPPPSPVQGSKLLTAMRYDSRTTTEIRARLTLRSTSRGANNRLDVGSIVSFDLEDGLALPLNGGFWNSAFAFSALYCVVLHCTALPSLHCIDRGIPWVGCCPSP